jgi:hypothetical protein
VLQVPHKREWRFMQDGEYPQGTPPDDEEGGESQG